MMASHRPPLCHSSRERSCCRALLCRSCRRPDIEGHLLPTRHVAVIAGELTTHGATEEGVVREEVGVVDFPHDVCVLIECG
jgi:hypothetical protein